MRSESPAWMELLDSPPEGSHLILWGDGSDECDAAIETFLRGGIARNDLAMVVLPREELADLTNRMAARGFDIDRLVRNGQLFLSASEEVGPRRPEEVPKIEKDNEAFRLFADNLGKKGMTLLERLAPPFFERGEQGMAEVIERATHEHRDGMRVLCLYRAQNLRKDQFADAVSLTRLHTHAVTVLRGQRFLVEPVTRRLHMLA